jgi:hypothetical protein
MVFEIVLNNEIQIYFFKLVNVEMLIKYFFVANIS